MRSQALHSGYVRCFEQLSQSNLLNSTFAILVSAFLADSTKVADLNIINTSYLKEFNL